MFNPNVKPSNRFQMNDENQDHRREKSKEKSRSKTRQITKSPGLEIKKLTEPQTDIHSMMSINQDPSQMSLY